MKFTKNLGISLLEVLLSLSIIAIILVMATRYYFVANNNNKINTSVNQVGGVVAAAQNWKGVNADFTGVSVQALYDAGQLTNFPGIKISGDTATMSDMWGGAINVSSTTGGGAQITADLPNSQVCQALVKAFPDNQQADITSTCTTGNQFQYTFS